MKEPEVDIELEEMSERDIFNLITMLICTLTQGDPFGSTWIIPTHMNLNKLYEPCKPEVNEVTWLHKICCFPEAFSNCIL